MADFAKTRENSRDGRVGGNVVHLGDRRTRGRPARPSIGRAAGPALVHWAEPYRPLDTAGYDRALIQTWALRCAGAIDDAEAARRDLALRRLRFALREGREAAP